MAYKWFDYTLFLFEDKEGKNCYYEIYYWQINLLNFEDSISWNKQNWKIIWNKIKSWKIKILNENWEELYFSHKIQNWFYEDINASFNNEIEKWNLDIEDKNEIENFLLKEILKNRLFSKYDEFAIDLLVIFIMMLVAILAILLVTRLKPFSDF